MFIQLFYFQKLEIVSSFEKVFYMHKHVLQNYTYTIYKKKLGVSFYRSIIWKTEIMKIRICHQRHLCQDQFMRWYELLNIRLSDIVWIIFWGLILDRQTLPLWIQKLLLQPNCFISYLAIPISEFSVPKEILVTRSKHNTRRFRFRAHLLIYSP